MAYFHCLTGNGSGGGGDLDGTLDGTVTSITSNVTSLIPYALYGITTLTNLSLPNVTTLGEQALRGCSGITSLTLGNLTSIGQYGLYGLGASGSTLEVNLDNCNVSGYAFQNSNVTKITGTWQSASGVSICRGCTSLTYLECNASSLGNYFVNGCTALADLYLTYTGGVVTVANTSLTNVPTTCTVHVPADLLTAYQSNATWNKYNLVAIS